MTVYIEYVLINNFIIDYLIFKSTFATTGFSVKQAWVFFLAFLSSVFSLVFPLIKLGLALVFCIKILFSLLLILIAGHYQNKKSFFANYIIFMFYTFLFGGGVMGVLYLLGVPLASEGVVCFITIPIFIVYLLVKTALKFLRKRKTLLEFIYQIEITVGETSKKLVGFLDTGNGLYDEDLPCIVCSKKTALEFFNGRLPKVKKIQVCTVNGNSQKFAIKIDRLVIYTGDKQSIHNNITMCVAEQGFQGYDVILHPALLEEQNVSKPFMQVEKIS